MPLAAFPKCFLEALCVTRTMGVEAWVELSQGLDVDGLEFYWYFTPADNPAALERIRKRVEDQGRSIPMMCYSPDFTQPDPQERRREVDRQKRAIEICSMLGTRFCRVLSGQRRPEVRRGDGIRWAAECIRSLLPTAERYGVTLVLENHYKDTFWRYPELAQQRDDFLELLDAVGSSPWFGVNFDPSNALIAGEDPIVLLEAVKQRVVTMHASDRYLEGATLEDLRRLEAHPTRGYSEILKHGVIGNGLNDYDRIFSLLGDVGFRGWISIEDGSDPGSGLSDMAASAQFLRRKMHQYGL